MHADRPHEDSACHADGSPNATPLFPQPLFLPHSAHTENHDLAALCRGLLGTLATVGREEGAAALWKGLEPGGRLETLGIGCSGAELHNGMCTYTHMHVLHECELHMTCVHTCADIDTCSCMCASNSVRVQSRIRPRLLSFLYACLCRHAPTGDQRWAAHRTIRAGESIGCGCFWNTIPILSMPTLGYYSALPLFDIPLPCHRTHP